MRGRGAGDSSGSKGGLGAAGTSPRSLEVPGVLGTPKQGASLWRPGLAGGDQGDAGRRGRSGQCRGGSIPKPVVLAWCPSRGEDAVLPKVSWGVPTPLLLRGMPQFTFACFCGLHGFCKMKRKKEESSAEQETAV
ncbi:bladder cancer associated transcript 1 isoform X2 [Anas platyrhynchos]|uniref:bladder cancer associated transcript 1 isoform X2 n=1 Tax=Anas platyrhynchos TaxID=8839 RepID=UPI003AF24277